MFDGSLYREITHTHTDGKNGRFSRPPRSGIFLRLFACLMHFILIISPLFYYFFFWFDVYIYFLPKEKENEKKKRETLPSLIAQTIPHLLLKSSPGFTLQIPSK